MNENKMVEVAKLFGKKLDEEFKIKDLSTGIIYIASFNNYRDGNAAKNILQHALAEKAKAT
mgnify:CR=1 FL=1